VYLTGEGLTSNIDSFSEESELVLDEGVLVELLERLFKEIWG